MWRLTIKTQTRWAILSVRVDKWCIGPVSWQCQASSHSKTENPKQLSSSTAIFGQIKAIKKNVLKQEVTPKIDFHLLIFTFVKYWKLLFRADRNWTRCLQWHTKHMPVFLEFQNICAWKFCYKGEDLFSFKHTFITLHPRLLWEGTNKKFRPIVKTLKDQSTIIANSQRQNLINYLLLLNKVAVNNTKLFLFLLCWTITQKHQLVMLPLKRKYGYKSIWEPERSRSELIMHRGSRPCSL